MRTCNIITRDICVAYVGRVKKKKKRHGANDRIGEKSKKGKLDENKTGKETLFSGTVQDKRADNSSANTAKANVEHEGQSRQSMRG